MPPPGRGCTLPRPRRVGKPEPSVVGLVLAVPPESPRIAAGGFVDPLLLVGQVRAVVAAVAAASCASAAAGRPFGPGRGQLVLQLVGPGLELVDGEPAGRERFTAGGLVESAVQSSAPGGDRGDEALDASVLPLLSRIGSLGPLVLRLGACLA